jgi:hypothetical protein
MSTWNCTMHQKGASKDTVNPCPWCKIAALEKELEGEQSMRDNFIEQNYRLINERDQLRDAVREFVEAATEVGLHNQMVPAEYDTLVDLVKEEG